MPVFAAAFSRVFLGEPIRLRMVLTMAAVILGLGVIAYGSGESEIASWKGDIWAFYVSAAFAAALTAVRKVKATSMIPAIPFAYIGAACVLAPFASPMEAFAPQWPLFLGSRCLHRRGLLPSGPWPALYQFRRGLPSGPPRIRPRPDPCLGRDRRRIPAHGRSCRRCHRHRRAGGVELGEFGAAEVSIVR